MMTPKANQFKRTQMTIFGDKQVQLEDISSGRNVMKIIHPQFSKNRQFLMECLCGLAEGHSSL